MAVKSTNSKLTLHTMAYNCLPELIQSCGEKGLAIPDWKEVVGGSGEQVMRDHGWEVVEWSDCNRSGDVVYGRC